MIVEQACRSAYPKNGAWRGVKLDLAMHSGADGLFVDV